MLSMHDWKRNNRPHFSALFGLEVGAASSREYTHKSECESAICTERRASFKPFFESKIAKPDSIFATLITTYWRKLGKLPAKYIMAAFRYAMRIKIQTRRYKKSETLTATGDHSQKVRRSYNCVNVTMVPI